MFYNTILFVFEWGFFVSVSNKEGEHKQEEETICVNTYTKRKAFGARVKI